MTLTYFCPACNQTNRIEIDGQPATAACRACGHTRTIAVHPMDGPPRCCLSCGNEDLWRQKDFPQKLGIAMVALGAVLSSIAWAWHRPIVALGILVAFGLIDMLLFWVMPDVLVCYRCRARHRVPAAGEGFAAYDHELGERYRQERLRLDARPSETGVQTAGR